MLCFYYSNGRKNLGGNTLGGEKIFFGTHNWYWMGCQKIKTIGWIVFEIIDGLAGSESSWDLNNPQVSFGSKQNWGTSSILKILTIFQFFGLKTLKMVKKFKNFPSLFLLTSLPTDWYSFQQYLNWKIK